MGLQASQEFPEMALISCAGDLFAPALGWSRHLTVPGWLQP